MYGYNEYIPLLSKEEILQRVRQEDIFNIIITDRIEEEKRYVSPFRSDTTAGCFFWRGDKETTPGSGIRKLFFVDYGSPNKTHYDCFNAIEQYFGLTFSEALEYINIYFGLGLGDENGKIILKEEEKEIIEPVKRIITIEPRTFNNKDRVFWEKYEISKQNLIDDGVKAVEWFQATSRRGELFSVRPLDICYAYTEFEDEKKKIYRPYADKYSKWLTNCGINDVGSIEHLPLHGDILVVSKSYKDCRVLRNQGVNSIWLQNEGMIPPTPIISNLGKRFEKIVVFFDNDRAGLEAADKVTNIFNSHFPGKTRSIHLPERLLESNGIKDPSDLVHEKGSSHLKQFLENNEIL